MLAVLIDKENLSDEQTDIIVTFHNSTIGHNGVERTIDRLLQAGHKWSGMRQDVKTFIKECACCQKTSAIKVAIQSNPFTTSSYEAMEVKRPH